MQRLLTISVLCLVALGTYTPHSNGAVHVLDFDNFENGQIIDSEYTANYGVTIDSVNYKKYHKQNDNVYGRQVAFDTTKNKTRDSDLEFNNIENEYNDASSNFAYTALNIPGYQGAVTPGNVLILQENGNGCKDGVCDKPDDEQRRAAGYFEFSFSSLVSILNLDFFDIEDQAGQDSKFYAIQFFDNDNNEIHKNNYLPTMGDGQFVRQAFSGINNVKRLVLNMPGSGAIDNLAFKTAEVPEPTAFAFFLIALGFTFRTKFKNML